MKEYKFFFTQNNRIFYFIVNFIFFTNSTKTKAHTKKYTIFQFFFILQKKNTTNVNDVQKYFIGNYSRLACEIQFVRSMGYYLIQIYIPSGLIVIISWVSFWLNRNATPGSYSVFDILCIFGVRLLLSSENLNYKYLRILISTLYSQLHSSQWLVQIN